jgi:hexulose-6-phosphate isomerase
MQGRLLPPVEDRFQSFPRGRWHEEFPLAAAAGLAAIEWIYDAYGAADNPIATDAGIERMLQLAEQHRVRIDSLCCDWLMDFPLVRTTPGQAAERSERLCWLLGRCGRAGIRRVVMPFVDVSKIATDDDRRTATAALRGVLPAAERTGIELHLETSLGPADFAEILAALPHPLVKVNYDSGNSASLGYDVREEFAAYGTRVGSVHIKDRVRDGGTVPLGSGNADLTALFDCLRSVRYSGDFILQVARGTAGEELAWVRQNQRTAQGWIKTLHSD